jgi:hypothetical protein
MPTTIPGQGISQQRPMAYPMTTEIPPHSVHAQMLKITANAGRTDPSTALVPPTPYNGMLAPTPQAFATPPQLSKRTKYVIGAAGLTLLAAILTIAVTKSGGSKAAAKTDLAATPTSGSANAEVAETPKPAPPIPEAAPPTPPPAPKDDKVATAQMPAPAPPPVAKVEDKPPEPKVEPKPEPKVEPKPEPKVEPKPVPKVEPKSVPKVEPKPEPKQITPAPKPEPVETPRPKPKQDRPPRRPSVAVAPPPPRAEPPPPPPRAEPPPPAAKKDPSDAIKQSDQAYAAKHFSEASSVLYAAAKGASNEDAQKLRHRGETIDHFAKSFNAGMAPAAAATDAYEKLRSAGPLDVALGGAHKSEIDGKLSQVAAKAALTYMASKQFEKALTAVEDSESHGVSNGNTRVVRDGLDAAARSLYNEASREADTNPADAKDKLRKMLLTVDSKSPMFDKGRKLLRQLDR